MEGKTVSHYRILEKIGEGGMGEVYLAEDTSLERKVALKFLPEYLRADEVAHMRFVREAKSAAAIDHPYICNIFEVARTDDGQDFIVMEYVEGQTLKEKLAEGRMPITEAARIATGIASALETAHQKGIVHRDLKPANIMLTQQGYAKVMDFGLAKQVATRQDLEQEDTSLLTREGTTLGTLAYMSPEQLRGEAVDTRADIFAFGIVFYEMLTGVHPFRKSVAAETVSAILRDDPLKLAQSIEEVPELLEHTVEKMMAKEVSHRYQSVQEASTDLQEVFAVSNLSDQSATLEFHAYDGMGMLLSAGKNPAQRLLNTGGQLALSGLELFEFDPSSSPVGWVELTTDNNRIGTLFQIGSTRQLDGARALTHPLNRMYFTRVIGDSAFLAGQNAAVRILVANPNPEAITLEMTLVSNEPKYPIGAKSLKETRILPPRGMFFETIDEIFGPTGFSDAYLRADVIEGEGAVALELIDLEEAETFIALSPLQADNESTHLFSAQLASGAGMFTSLKLLNTAGEIREATLRAIGDSGEDLAVPVTLSLTGATSPLGRKFIEVNASELFDLPSGLTVGSLRIETDGPGVVGDMVFGEVTSLEYAAALPLQSEGFTEAVFSHAANNSVIFTGLAFYNPGAEAADIKLEVFARDGSLTGSSTLTLEAGVRFSKLLPELVPASAGYLGGYIIVRSTQPIIGQQLFGDFNQTYLSASPPTIRAK